MGAVAWDAERELGSFEYAEEFRRSGLEVAPLTMPLGPAIYSFPELDRVAFRGLPGMLADSLPDRWGTRLVNAWLDRQGRPRESFNPVERLCYVGSRGMGALEYAPAIRGYGRSLQVDVDELVTLAEEILSVRGEMDVHLDDEGLATLLQVGTSAGGVRAKAVIAWNPGTGETRSGQVTAPEGFEYWIIKFDGVGSDDGEFTDPRGYGRVEFAYHEMARDAGIEVTEARLHVDAGGRGHFMSKRFDRTGSGEKIHAQTLQGIAHLDYNLAGEHSWEQALGITQRLCGHAAAEQLFRRMVFNVVTRNQDDHTKNVTFLMDRVGRWSLAPAYDVTWAYNPASTWTSRHQMTIAGKREGFETSDLVEAGSMVGVRSPKTVLIEVTDVAREWGRYADEAGVTPEFEDAVAHSLRTGL